jgi:hypothetical protein
MIVLVVDRLTGYTHFLLSRKSIRWAGNIGLQGNLYIAEHVNKIISQYIEIGNLGASCWRLALKKEMSACHLETYVTTKRPNDTFKVIMLRDVYGVWEETRNNTMY